MVVDKLLITGILDLLAARGDHGRSLDGLATEVSIRLERDITRSQAEQALTFARNRGWVQERCDAWGEPCWFITPAGANRQAM